MWPFGRKQPLPIATILSKKSNWPYDSQVTFGLKQVRKLEGSDRQIEWLRNQLNYLAGKRNVTALNLCVDVIHQYSMFSDREDAAELFQHSTDVLSQVTSGTYVD